uniref:Uncharacterized protein n=1 Tax=Rhizophora mucronata TaxID=61149 RepID=A0A2P2R232_RHIMU
MFLFPVLFNLALRHFVDKVLTF